MNQLLQMLKGRSVAFVGNGPVDGDCSKEIDAADIVIRLNHFYRYDEGKTGKKTDIVLQTFAKPWTEIDNAARHIDVIEKHDVTIFMVKRPENYNTSVHKALGPNRPIVNLARHFSPWWRFTTGGAAICYLASVLDELKGTKIAVYGMNGGKTWNDYIKTDAAHYANVAAEERVAVDKAKVKIAEFSAAQTLGGAIEIPYKVVVPVKRTSSGLHSKNHLLSPALMERLQGFPMPVAFVGDDESVLGLAAKFGFDICAMPTIGTYDDVTDTLRNYRARTGYCGYMAVVAATSPDMKAEWITRSFEELKHHPLVATAYELRKKFTAIYREADGVYVQATRDCGATSVARQFLPRAVMLNGAVVAFHSDALDFKSFYEAAVMKPVVVAEEESTDVDSIKDMK